MGLPVVVLVEPSHPGNIGAVARAMKTMGHMQLRLVNPKKSSNDSEAIARASSAGDVLTSAKCYASLEDAVFDCDLVLALSNRPRTLNWPVYSPRHAAEKFLAVKQKIALVFGRESNGLSNDEVNICNAQITIATNSCYGSLNLSHAVQLTVYEFYNVFLQHSNQDSMDLNETVLHFEAMQLKEHFNKTLEKLPFFDMSSPGHTLSRLFCLINRAQPNKNELNLLHGILSAMDKVIDGAKNED